MPKPPSKPVPAKPVAVAKPATPARPQPKPAPMAQPATRVAVPVFVPAAKVPAAPAKGKQPAPVTPSLAKPWIAPVIKPAVTPAKPATPLHTTAPAASHPQATPAKPPVFATTPAHTVVIPPPPPRLQTPAKPVTPAATGTAAAPAKTPVVMTAVPQLHPQTTPAINNLRFIDPHFVNNIINLRPAAAGEPRDKMKAPIAPAFDVTDEMLFEDPAQPAKKYYLPRYALASDHEHYQVSFKHDNSGWSFVVRLTKSAAPSLATAAASAQEIDHHVAVLARYSQMIGNQAGAQEELAFQEVGIKDGVLEAKLRLTSLQQRDSLYQALRDRTFATALLVRRAITVAVPVPQAVAMPIGILARIPQPQPPQPSQPAVPLYRQADRVVEQAVDPRPFVFSPDLHSYIFKGVTPASTGETLQLTRYQVPWTDGRSHTYYQDPARPAVMYYMPDSFKVTRRPDGAHEPLMSVRFGQAASVDDLQATFSFVGVPYASPQRLQDAAQKLKTKAKDSLPKDADIQFEPLLSAPEKTHFKMAYPGCDSSKGPFELRDKAAVDLRSGISDSLTLALPKFQSLYDALFSSSSVVLTGAVDVELGADAGEEIPFAARLSDLAGDVLAYSEQPLTPGAADGSSAGQDGPSMTDSVTSAIGDAITGDVKGAVTDILGGVAGKLLHHAKKDKDKDKDKKKKKPAASVPMEQGIQATLQNIIESPVEISSLTATLVRDQERLAAVIDGLDLSQPVQVGPGEQITFTVRPADQVTAGAPVHVEYDLSGVRAAPDRDAIWKEILDPNTTDSYLTTITVKTTASTFAVPKDDADSQVVSVVVDFESGVSAELNSGKLETKIDLPHSVSDYVLRKPDAGAYRYKRTLVRTNGEQVRDSDWRAPETTTVLYVTTR